MTTYLKTTALSTRYGFGRRLALPFAEAVTATKAALAAEGFGILSEIDVAATLRSRLGVELEPYLILGACNPPLAHRALTVDREIGLLLPCNVVVYEQDGTTHVSAVDAARMLSIVDNDALGPIAEDVRTRLARVIDQVPD